MTIDAWDVTTAGCAGKGRVRRLVARILEDPSPDCSVEWLAARAALSPRALSRIFVRETGTTPAKFVEGVRVRCACRMMETDLLMKAIAARVGFGSEERMRRAFRRVLGVSPRQVSYRETASRRRAPILYGAVVLSTGSNLRRSV